MAPDTGLKGGTMYLGIREKVLAHPRPVAAIFGFAFGARVSYKSNRWESG
jgi:hypothetical protein